MTLKRSDRVVVGDHIRFSVPVLKQWEAEEADDVVLRLKDVQVQADGVKVLVLERTTPLPDDAC